MVKIFTSYCRRRIKILIIEIFNHLLIILLHQEVRTLGFYNWKQIPWRCWYNLSQPNWNKTLVLDVFYRIFFVWMAFIFKSLFRTGIVFIVFILLGPLGLHVWWFFPFSTCSRQQVKLVVFRVSSVPAHIFHYCGIGHSRHRRLPLLH